MAEDRFWIGVHGVVVMNARLLVLRRAPEMHYRPGAWDLPGGHLCIGEGFEEALLREVAEETGLRVETERLLGLHNSSGPQVQAFYACRLADRQVIEIRLRPTEHVEARWVTPAELSQLVLIPYLEGILRRGMLAYLGS